MSENLTKAKKALEDENYEQLAVEANKVCNIDGDYKAGIELLSKGLAKQPSLYSLYTASVESSSRLVTLSIVVLLKNS